MNFFKNIKSLLVFASPIIFGQLGQMLIGAGDVFVAARHGVNTVASISIANAIITIIFMTGFGLLLSISPVLSKERGKKTDINKFLNITLLYAAVLSVIFMIITLSLVPIIPYMGFEKVLVPNIQEYIYICSFSFLGAYIYHALKEFLQSYEKVMFANTVAIIAVFLNLLIAWILVFGCKFIPSIGVQGLAIATLVVRSLMGLALIVYCHKFFKKDFYFDKQYLKKILNIGYPISLSLLLELSAFSFVTILVGNISSVQVAAHSIVFTFASITFMVPLAVSNALGVRIGYAYGAKNYQDIKDNLIAALSLSLSVMSIFALMFLVFPQGLMSIFSTDKNIILTGSGLLFIAALFQIFDGTQITLSGALRGLGSTKPILFTMMFGYWAVGLPLGIYLAFVKHLKIYGLWIGLAVALFTCSLIFSAVLIKKLKKCFADLK
ncbi:MAG: MATE family efflux transporter [bacterium]